MLFVNFLCLLYLMLLVNGHTLSKNIDNFYSDERVDSLHDFDYTTRPKSRYDKFLHKHRRFKSAVTETTKKVTSKGTTQRSKTTETTAKPPHLKVHKSTRRRIGGFWRKYKTKENKILLREKRLKHHLKNDKYCYETPLVGSGSRISELRTKPSQSIYTFPFEKKKRGVTKSIQKRLNKQKEQKGLKNIEVNVTPYENFGNILKVTKHFKSPPNANDINQMITTMATKVAELKKLYGLDKTISTEAAHKYLYTPKSKTTPKTTTEMDIIGTAQIEALLNDIKGKAINMMAEQNPAITELITNTVTEATFEADPLLNHLEINSHGKRDTSYSFFLKSPIKSNFKMTTYNYRKERSIKEEAMTAAQSIEDLLQKEMKNIYKKVKNKVSGDFRKEVDKVKTTLKHKTKTNSTKATLPKDSHNSTSKMRTCSTPSSQNRVDRKSGKHTKVTEQEIVTTPGVDDYALLTLYEQMLAKTCQNNIMNMISTQDRLIRSKRNGQSVPNRNFETIFDQKLKEDVNKLYEDKEEIPDDLEYNFELNIPEISTSEATAEKDYPSATGNDEEVNNYINEHMNTGITTNDDSYESLSSKMSYHEFVNGYRHYLNFQKEQANQNFSNLVRYQAHRHHSVDDIGKYILEKIPQIPPRNKRFLEYEDDLKATSKNKQSWLKKHFYIFIENGTPKKYHTSQTISLKSPTPDIYDKPTMYKIEFLETPEADILSSASASVYPDIETNMNVNLEELSHILEVHKYSTAKIPAQEISQRVSTKEVPGKYHGYLFKSLTPHHIMDKVFSKDRKDSHKANVQSFNIVKDVDYTDTEVKEVNKDSDILSANERVREKRAAKNTKAKLTTIDNDYKFKTKKNAKLVNVTKSRKKTDNRKVGCVDIDLVVPQPTALVKLKETKPKESKLKKFLHKLHFSKPNKKKVKREYKKLQHSRKQRSNPFKILKNIFKSSTKGTKLKDDFHLSDYEMATSRIDTFKPIKFQKALSIDEMSKQVPNITYDSAANSAPKFGTNDVSWNSQSTEKGFSDTADSEDTTVANLPMMLSSTFFPQLVRGRVRYPIINTTGRTQTQNLESLITANVETKSSYKPIGKQLKYPQHLALQDISDQVEDLIMKITSEDTYKKSSTEGTTTTNYKMLLNNKKTGNKDIAKNTISYHYISIPKTKTHSKAHLKMKPKCENHTIMDLSKNSELVEDNRFVKSLGHEFNIMDETTVAMPIPSLNLFTLGASLHEDESLKYKQFPDYFSDLLMWHKDILYSDKVPTPWRDILKNMNREAEYISPDIIDLQQELIKINDALNTYSFKPKNLNMNAFAVPPSAQSSHKGVARNELHNMVLEKPPVGKSLFLKEEKKYVKFEPKIVIDRNLEAADLIQGINKVAKYMPKYKINKIQDATEAFTDDRDGKDQPVILLDTTLLSYDDDVNYVSTLTPRELSKFELKFEHLDNNGASSHKSKNNKQPAQYFSTPLPMRMNDFEDFLKANNIDVGSVTTPLIGLPTMNAYASKQSPKSKTLIKESTTKTHTHHTTKSRMKTTLPFVNKSKEATKEDKHKKETGNQFEYLNKLEKSLFTDYISDKKDRYKRYNDEDIMFMNFNSITNLKPDKIKQNRFMSKPKILHNDKPVANKINDYKTPKTTENIKPNDFEITIINFGDINKLTDKYLPSEKVIEVTNPPYKEGDKTRIGVESIEKDSKDSQFMHKLHNDFFYDRAFTVDKEATTDTINTINFDVIKEPTLSFDLHEAILNKMPIEAKHHPKRVRISGQSYKYDIIYHHPEKKEKYRDTLSMQSFMTTTDSTPNNLPQPNNRDFIGERDVARSDVSKARFVRKIQTSKKCTPEKIETLQTSSVNTILQKSQQRQRLKRLFPVIQNKLKMFSKSLSTPRNFKQKPTTIILSTPFRNSSQGSVTTIDDKKSSILLLNTGVNTEKKSKCLCKNDSDQTLEKERELEFPDVEIMKGTISQDIRTSNLTDLNSNKDYINKREIPGLETHTAKDVAALEVIVDMMKNTLNYDSENIQALGSFNDQKNIKLHANDKLYPISNSIQVHIAVPYEVENSKKRSLEPVKVRKVFSAKLCTPVDIEYQVHSFEAQPTTEKASETIEGLTPGVYLLVDNPFFPQGVALKPVHPNLPLMNVRQVKPATEKITSTIATKNLAKVTLSKDFISAINKQLIQLYNLTKLNKEEHDLFQEMKKDRIFKRSLNWEAVKKLFGHDRVCHCKCKVNKTLCRACAASDAVMSELIFEFENLSKYMKDHCTEIQTYFWMNPSGGKRLKDSVHKIDQSLRDYYKRVKGKCHGRTCKTFATYIDKREFHKYNKKQKNPGNNFIHDLEKLTKDVGRGTRTATCFKENIIEEFKKFKCCINECVYKKSYDKRSKLIYRQGKDIKNVYSLDNVNVNIICKPESSVPLPSPSTPNQEKNVWIDPEYRDKNPKGFKRLFSCFRKNKKEKSLSEYWKQTTKQFAKRAIKENQIESPLIADTGGSFWHDYIKKSSYIPKFPKGNKSKIEISLFQTNHDSATNADEHGDLNDLQFTTSTTQKYTEREASGDAERTGSTNTIELFIKPFSVIDVREITGGKLTTAIQKSTTQATKTKKIKHKKTKTKIHKIVKTKMRKQPKPVEVIKPLNSTTTPQSNIVTSNMRFSKTIELFKTKSKPTTQSTTAKVTNTSTGNQFIKKIKMLTTGFFHIKNKTKNVGSIKRENYMNSTLYQTTTQKNTKIIQESLNDVHVISGPTSEMNPNILIIEDVDDSRLSKYKDLLLSIIDYESNKLNKEWMRFANINLEKDPNDRKTTASLKNTSQNKEETINYDILRDLQGLLQPEVNKTTKTISNILDKIANKFKSKADNQESKKAGEQKTPGTDKKTSTVTTTSQTPSVDKEADDTTAAPRLCNMEATSQHIIKSRQVMPLEEFENYVANVTCQKYEPVPRTIFLDRSKTGDRDKKIWRKWSWIRDRRSLCRYKLKHREKIDCEIRQGSYLEFEVFFKGDNGIYKQILRRKRSIDSEDSLSKLKGLPRIRRNRYEIYAIAGDTVKFNCLNDSKRFLKDITSIWESERDGMLNYTNVAVLGNSISFVNVQPKNDGYYYYKDGLVKRNIKLAVLALPNFIWTSSLIFTKETECSHKDLKHLKSLGKEMSKKVFQRQSSVAISDPVCLEDRADARTKLGAIVKVNCRRPLVNCSVQCRRDLQAGFASICAENVRAMASIKVMALENGLNKTWIPSDHGRLIITRTLRDLTNQYDHKTLKEFTPKNLQLVISCPAGYRLLSNLKVCAPCPVNTYAREGDNVCFVCPRGLSSAPGADKCRRTSSRSRRYDWWMYPPCGYGMAAVVAVCCCGVCVTLALLVHLTSRSCGATDIYKTKKLTDVHPEVGRTFWSKLQDAAGSWPLPAGHCRYSWGRSMFSSGLLLADDEEGKFPVKPKCRMNPSPTRSSRVILSRFFRPSLTSSLATDSQETKFDMWKARNLPPPLPPVDFDS